MVNLALPVASRAVPQSTKRPQEAQQWTADQLDVIDGSISCNDDLQQEACHTVSSDSGSYTPAQCAEICSTDNGLSPSRCGGGCVAFAIDDTGSCMLYNGLMPELQFVQGYTAGVRSPDCTQTGEWPRPSWLLHLHLLYSTSAKADPPHMPCPACAVIYRPPCNTPQCTMTSRSLALAWTPLRPA